MLVLFINGTSTDLIVLPVGDLDHKVFKCDSGLVITGRTIRSVEVPFINNTSMSYSLMHHMFPFFFYHFTSADLSHFSQYTPNSESSLNKPWS